MKTVKILKNNSQLFLEDLKRATNIIVYAEKTDSYFSTTKKELLNSAEIKQINYFMSENMSSHGYTMIIR